MAERTPIEIEKEIVKAYLNGNSSVLISKNFNIAPTTVCKIIERNGYKMRSNKENSKIYSFNKNYFQEIDSQEKAYWLGYMYADGYICINNHQYVFGMSLAEKDEFVLHKFKKCLEATHPINKYVSTGYGENTYFRLAITSEKTVKDLIKHGVVAQKTNILKAPNIESLYIPHFIRGYFDGDGCITNHLSSDGYTVYAVKILGTLDILNYIKHFIESNTDIRINNFYKRKPEQLVSSLELGTNNQSRIFLDLLYENATIFLERKYQKYIELCNFNNISRSRKKFLD